MAPDRSKKPNAPWRPVSEFDVDQHSECWVRCNCGRPNCRPMHAYWTAIEGKDGTKYRMWALKNGVTCGLHDIAEFRLIGSMPFKPADRGPVVLKGF